MRNEAVASGVIARPGLGLSNDLSSVDTPPWLRPEAPAGLPCLAEPDMFFPWTYGLQCRQQIEDARAACAACPMMLLCREWAVPRTDLDGIWAGTTPPERRRIRTGKAA